MITKEQYNLSLAIVKKYNDENPLNEILVELDENTFKIEEQKLINRGYSYSDIPIINRNNEYSALFIRNDYKTIL
jgi:hypothetical protein